MEGGGFETDDDEVGFTSFDVVAGGSTPLILFLTVIIIVVDDDDDDDDGGSTGLRGCGCACCRSLHCLSRIMTISRALLTLSLTPNMLESPPPASLILGR